MESTRPIEAEPALLREGRTLTSVGTKIPGGEFLVYYYAAPDSIRCDPDGNALSGGNEAGRLFHSLEDARAYAATRPNPRRKWERAYTTTGGRSWRNSRAKIPFAAKGRIVSLDVFCFGRPHSFLLEPCFCAGNPVRLDSHCWVSHWFAASSVRQLEIGRSYSHRQSAAKGTG